MTGNPGSMTGRQAPATEPSDTRAPQADPPRSGEVQPCEVHPSDGQAAAQPGRRVRPGGPASVIRLSDVARLAGVSTATVSRAISRPDMVSQSAREAVLAAVEETGYKLNVGARNFRHQRTNNIIAMVPRISSSFYADVLDGIAATVAVAGYDMLVADTRVLGDPRAIVETYLDTSRADGVILLDGGVPPEALDGSPGRAIPPLVLACEWIAGRDAPQIHADDADGIRQAVGHLQGLGHRCIGHLRGPAGNVIARVRAAAFQADLAARGLPPGPGMDTEDFTIDAGAAAAATFLALPERPTAVVCASDELAIGFIWSLARAGLEVPRDVSVVGFDDIAMARHLPVPLTTIAQRRQAIGEAAAETVLEMIRTPGARPPDVELPVDLVVRATTSRPRRG